MSEPERVVRAITMPVRGIVGGDGNKVLDTFRPAWRLSTDLANWCQRQLALTDPGLRTPDAKKLEKYQPKMFPGGKALYAHVGAACPFRRAFDGAAGSMSSVVKAVEDAWRSHPRFGRMAVLWKGAARPAVFRFPYPWPVRSQEFRIYRDADNRPCASLTLPSVRVEVILPHAGRDRGDFARQLKAFDVLLGDVKRVKQAKLTGRFDQGQLVGADLKIVGAFDVRPKAENPVAAVVRTDPNALLVVEIEGRPAWVLNADHVPALVARHKVFLQRTHEDLKREKRLNRDQRAGLVQHRANRAEKQGHRLDTLVHQITAQVAGLCERSGVGTVVYDDSVKSFVPDGFPWHMMKSRLAYKLEASGCEMVTADPAAV